MKYIANHSKKLKVKLIIDALNSAKIFKQKIPYLKLHNRIPDKKYNNSDNIRVWLTLKDIEEHSKNPQKVCDRLRLEEKQSKIYHQKTTEYQTEIEFYDDLTLDSNSLESIKIIKNYIKEKIKGLNTNEWEYQFEFDSEEILDGKQMYLKVTRFCEDCFTVYYGVPTFFYINIIDSEKGKNYIKIELNNRLVFNLFIFV